MAQPALTPIPATSPSERQQQLLADAGRYLAGGGMGLFGAGNAHRADTSECRSEMHDSA